MTSRNVVFRRSLSYVLAAFGTMAIATVLYGQPLQNPFENPFDTPQAKPAQPAPGNTVPDTAQPGQLPAELRGPDTPGRAAPSRPRPSAKTEPLPETAAPTTRDSGGDNPFTDDLVQPDDADTRPAPSTKPSTRPSGQLPRDSTERRTPDDMGAMPESDGYSNLPEGVDPALVKKIDELNEAGKYEESIPLMEALVKERPDVYGAWSNLGTAYRRVGRYDEAIAVFGAMANAAANANMPQEQSEAHLMRGISWFYKGEPRIAVAEFEQALSASINDPRPEFWKGLSYAKQERYREAILAYSSSLRLFNGYTLARNNRGLAYLAIGELNFAVADFDEVIRQAPDDASAYYKRAIALARRGDLRDAVASYDQAIRLDPNFAPSYYNRGLLHRRLGNTQQADADLAKARQLNPQVQTLARPARLARRQVRRSAEL
jgi:tetratricopeptide (TPR) repeat protein